MGVNSVLVGVSEFVTFFFADHVIKLIGYMGVIYVDLFVHAMRFIVYASITNPWAVLLMSVPDGYDLFSLISISYSCVIEI